MKAISNQPFVSRASGFKLKQNFTTEAIIVRSYARKEDEDFIKTVASTMTASSSISLLILDMLNRSSELILLEGK